MNDNNAQYLKCDNCNHGSTPYDCLSIMHYRDNYFANSSNPTMVANDPDTCDLKRTNEWLRWADIDLLNDNYQCRDPIRPVSGKGVLKSHDGYPEGDYPKMKSWIEYLVVEEGSRIEFEFLEDFGMEDDLTCKYDSVEIVDGNTSDL